MTDRLTLYNDALLICGQRALGSLTESVESRRLLDQAWNGGAVQSCLEEGQWKFAMRTKQIEYDDAVAPDFGYQRAFAKPTDWVLTSSLCSDEYFTSPVLRYNDEAGYWYSDLDTLYVRYVSSDAQYGLNIGLWPQSFKDFVVAFLAKKVVQKLTGGNADRIKLAMTEEARTKKQALNKDAMADPPKMQGSGSWNRARRRGSTRRDGGNLTGDLY